METSLYRTAQKVFRYIEPFRRDCTSVTDGKTDRRYRSKRRASLRCVAKNCYRFLLFRFLLSDLSCYCQLLF